MAKGSQKWAEACTFFSTLLIKLYAGKPHRQNYCCICELSWQTQISGAGNGFERGDLLNSYRAGIPNHGLSLLLAKGKISHTILGDEYKLYANL